jgi:hypothetical protein
MSKKSDWLIPAGLVLLAIVPSVSGAMRLVGLAQGGPVTAENARFYSAPYTVAVHMCASLVFSLVGALQFSPRFRRRYPRWHRLAGGLLIAAGSASALTGLAMTLIFPRLSSDGPTLFTVRLLVGLGMLLSIVLSVRAVLSRQYREHGAWISRAYALGMGAATQAITHLPWLIAAGALPTGYARDAAMAAGWLINVAVVEWWLVRVEPEDIALRGHSG